MKLHERIRIHGFLLPLCDAVARSIHAISVFRFQGTSLAARDGMTAGVFLFSILLLVLSSPDAGAGWRWIQWMLAGYLVLVTVSRSFEAAVLELWRNPDHRRVSNARSFLHVCLAYFTIIALFGVAYRLSGVSLGEALELTVSFGTNLGNNFSLSNPLIRGLRIAESVIGTFYLVVMIGRFGGAFSKKRGTGVTHEKIFPDLDEKSGASPRRLFLNMNKPCTTRRRV